MKKVFLLLFVVFSLNTYAQEQLTWHRDINKAIEISKKENKPMMLFFTGSDWCGWCMKLQKEVFKTDEFIQWAKTNVVLVELDFPRRSAQPDSEKTQNMNLQQMFGVRGYPTVFFVKAGEIINGQQNYEQLGNTGYVAGGPKAWLAVADPMVKKFTAYLKTKTKAKAKTKKAKSKS